MSKPIKRFLLILRQALRRIRRGDPDKFLDNVSGVIHIGAHAAQEREVYDKRGLKVVWIEANPEVYKELEKNVGGEDRHTPLNYLITDVDDKQYAFHISTNNGGSSSILELKDHKKMWPEVGSEETIHLMSMSLPSILAKESIDPADYGALVLDVQGAELLVLSGARPVLPEFRYVKTEAADFEAYEGCCQVGDLCAFMAEEGFREVYRKRNAYRPGVGTYYDILFAR